MNMSCEVSGCNKRLKTMALIIDPKGGPHEFAFCEDHVQKLDMDYMLPDPASLGTQSVGETYEECRFHAVLFIYDPEQFLIVLRSTQSPSFFVFPTGFVEACSIRYIGRKTSSPNPLTHDLIVKIIDAVGGSLHETVLYGYDKNVRTYLCQLVIGTAGGIVKVRCRVSDAVAIALVSNIPVNVNTAFLGRPPS